MCGINGMVFLNGVERNAEMMAKVRYVFDELMVETQDRGEHATGLASFKRDGSYEFHKNNINADKMTTEDEKYRKIVANFNGEETGVVIAHTRYLTKGVATNMNNNHPFDIGNVVGLHNGSAKNDDFLFGKYKENFKRIGQVDSEIVFQLINHYNREDISLLGLKNALEDTNLRGLFALAFVHKNSPNMLHLIKQDKPMHLAYWKEAGIIIFNSIDEYIEKAFRKLERVGSSLGVSNAKQDVKILSVGTDKYFTINADATTLEEAVSEEVRFFIESSAYVYTDTKTYTSSKTGTSTTTGKDKVGNSYQSVTAKDSKGLVLQGEIDTITGEVVIWSDDITDADDGSGLMDDAEACIECQEWLTEEEVISGYNSSNPKGERVCSVCYADIIESYISESDKEDQLENGSRVG
jgi:glucosamine 6-phosphate synthetase-like amidotransferase/phosphosugar isomerase protein